MFAGKKSRLREVAKEFNVGTNTIVDFLGKKGIKIENNPNARIEEDVYTILHKEYASDIDIKRESEKLSTHKHQNKTTVTAGNTVKKAEDDYEEEQINITDFTAIKEEKQTNRANEFEEPTHISSLPKTEVKIIGKIDLDKKTEKEAEPTIAIKSETIPPEEKVQIATKKEEPEIKTEIPEQKKPKIIGKIEIANKKKTEKKQQVEEKQEPIIIIKEPEVKEPQNIVEPQEKIEKPDDSFIPSQVGQLSGPTVVGKIILPEERKKKPNVAAVATEKTTPKDDAAEKAQKKKRRKRIKKEKTEDQNQVQKDNTSPQNKPVQQENQKKKKFDFKKKPFVKPEIKEDDVSKKVKDTLALLTSKNKSKTAKYRKDKREALNTRITNELDEQQQAKKVLKLTEFVSVNDLASMMNVPVTEVISTCMDLGMFVTINHRLDAKSMTYVVDEFGFTPEFVSAGLLNAIDEETDREENLSARPPIITVMGHVDHGKTSLLDYIRKTNVIAGEAGGITQHIGAYNVKLSNGENVTFLDTPGHQAFTSMRARGSQITDIVIIVVAADDSVMPQTREAISHAQAAGVPIVFAINKIDKENSNPEKIKEELAQMNILVEDWGGKYQSQEISAKTGKNVKELLEKVLLEADIMNLRANPNRKASGTIIESQLDKGRGHIATILVQNGTLKLGDVILAGAFYGNIRAMFDERGQRVAEVGPACPIQVLGLNGAPSAGDKFNVMDGIKEAREVALKREHLERELSVRTKKHFTLDEIGRRRAIGDFKELNLIVKGDVDGSVEAISDSLLKLSTEKIQVNVIYKAIGQISESDVMLAIASNAIILGFQVRPSLAARKLAEKEEIDIRLYSIIFNAIDEIRGAMEGMLSPELKEQIVGTAEIIEIFKITKVGTIAGCIVREGKIKRTNKVRAIRDGIVIYSGTLGSLKRFKDDVKEVNSGFDCGMNVDNFNDIKVGDFIEAFEETEVRSEL